MNLIPWNGGNLAFGDLHASTILMSFGLLGIVILVFLSFFSNQIRSRYSLFLELPAHRLKMRLLAMSWALTLSLMFIVRLVIFARPASDAKTIYPYLWELIPLHFTRLSLVINIVILFLPFKLQKRAILYYGFFSLITGALAFFSPDLNGGLERYRTSVNWGYDSFVYWDYISVHFSNIVIPWLIFILYRPLYTFKKLMVSISIIVVYMFLVFFLNLALDKVNSTFWRANWGYLASDQANPYLKNLVPPFTKFPQHVFVFSIAFSLVQMFSTIVYIYSESLTLEMHHWRLQLVRHKSKMCTYFVHSIPERIKNLLLKFSFRKK